MKWNYLDLKQIRCVVSEIVILLNISAAGLPSATASTIPTRDQYAPSDVSSGGWSQAINGHDLSQSFPVTLDGYLALVDLYINKQTNQTGNMLWDIRNLSAGKPIESNGSALASGSMPIANLPAYWNKNPITLDLSASQIRVHPGDVLAIVIRSSSTGGAFWLSHSADNPGVKFVRNTGGMWQADTFSPTRAHAFATYVTVVPEPSSFVLLLAGMLFAAAQRRYYRRRLVA